MVSTRSQTKAKDDSEPSLFRVMFAVVFYMSMSVGLVVLNKKVLSNSWKHPLHGNFSSPLFTTWFQFVVTTACAVVATPLFASKENKGFVRRIDFSFNTAFRVGKLTLVFVLMLLTNNLSLDLVPVSFYPVARSLSIFFTLIMSAVGQGEHPSLLVAVSCFVVMTGFFVGAWGQIDPDLMGTFWGVVSSFFVSLFGIVLKQTLPVVDKSDWRLMVFNNFNAALIFLPFVLYSGELERALRFDVAIYADAWFNLVLSGIMGFVLSLATNMIINTTTPLTHLISGTSKNAILEVVSILFLGELHTVTPASGCGIVLNLGGSAWYSYLRFQERHAAKEPTKSKSA